MQDSFLNLEKEKVIKRIIDLCLLKERSLVKTDRLIIREIKRGHKLRKSNIFKLCVSLSLVCISYLCLNFHLILFLILIFFKLKIQVDEKSILALIHPY